MAVEKKRKKPMEKLKKKTVFSKPSKHYFQLTITLATSSNPKTKSQSALSSNQTLFNIQPNAPYIFFSNLTLLNLSLLNLA